MVRTNLYLKVEIAHEEDENLERLIEDIARQIRKVYGVTSVEVSSSVSRAEAG